MLLSDGASTKGKNPIAAAQEAKRAKIPVYTVALGTPAGTIRSRAPAAAAPRPGASRPTPTASRRSRAPRAARPSPPTTPSELKRVYQRLGSQLGTERRKRQLTSSFAGGALVLLLVGAGMSLAWFGRLV